ncbi:hypothetical protein NVP1110O_46 [Vibrio phage 1.110.O._10N.261.52.C1]|nr:hypothetical protein NVP1110O_46 [Vibrio phage 1.110.O._10N.261.52.C1]
MIGKSATEEKYNGLPKATYYRRLKEWTLTLYDKDGKAYHVNPKHVMEKANKD